MKVLSSEVIKKYDYKETRKKVNEFMEKFEENYFRYLNVLPPSITSHLSEIKVQMSNLSTSPIERYVLKKKNALRVQYAHTVSFKTDVTILLMTVRAVLDKALSYIFKRKHR